MHFLSSSATAPSIGDNDHAYSISRLMNGGESSVEPAVSQRWIHSQIPNSLQNIFPTVAGGYQ